VCFRNAPQLLRLQIEFENESDHQPFAEIPDPLLHFCNVSQTLNASDPCVDTTMLSREDHWVRYISTQCTTNPQMRFSPHVQQAKMILDAVYANYQRCVHPDQYLQDTNVNRWFLELPTLLEVGLNQTLVS
jgi:hypothetical protein